MRPCVVAGNAREDRRFADCDFAEERAHDVCRPAGDVQRFGEHIYTFKEDEGGRSCNEGGLERRYFTFRTSRVRSSKGWAPPEKASTSSRMLSAMPSALSWWFAVIRSAKRVWPKNSAAEFCVSPIPS